MIFFSYLVLTNSLLFINYTFVKMSNIFKAYFLKSLITISGLTHTINLLYIYPLTTLSQLLILTLWESKYVYYDFS